MLEHAKGFLVLHLQGAGPDRMMFTEMADESRQQQIGVHHPEHQELEHQGGDQPAHHPPHRVAPHGRALHGPDDKQHAGDHDIHPSGEHGPQHPCAERTADAVLTPEPGDDDHLAPVGARGLCRRAGLRPLLAGAQQGEENQHQAMAQLVAPAPIRPVFALANQLSDLAPQGHLVSAHVQAQMVRGFDLGPVDAQVAPAPRQRREGDQHRQQSQRHGGPGADAFKQEHRFTEPVVGQGAAHLVRQHQREDKHHQRDHDVPGSGVV
ncbi:hypothetical protein D3C86_1440660 [compost metagenome]